MMVPLPLQDKWGASGAEMSHVQAFRDADPRPAGQRLGPAPEDRVPPPGDLNRVEQRYAALLQPPAPGLVDLLRGAQLDVFTRRLLAEQVGEDALAVVGVVEEQEQVAQADQRVGAVARAGQRIRAAVYVAHHVDSHVTTVSRPGRTIVTRKGWAGPLR